MKLHRGLSVIAASLMIAPSLLADTTVPYKYDFKAGSTSPAAAAALAAVQAKVPKTSVIQIKGKLGRTTTLQYVTVSDFERQVVTLIDPAHHQYATVYMKDYADQVLSILQAEPEMPSGAEKIMDSIQSTFESHETGKTDIIAGIKAGETEMTFTLSMPIPVGAGPSTDALPPTQPQVLFRLVMHVWRADSSELRRVPALNEFNTVYGDPTAMLLMSQTGSTQNLFQSMPGMGKGLAGLTEALQTKGLVILKTQDEMYMPMLAKTEAAVARMKAANQGKSGDQATAPDEEAPAMVITMEVEEISGAPIDDAAFAVPRDCRLVSMPDLLKANLPAAKADASNAPVPSAPVAADVTDAPKD
jgi:hypothetical protein